ncbi:MAG: prepilin-type N-terminal cleavage/methylation domain-containing protein, partial [Synergistaceae bacterium]|nr:prepilin-type N-terminal cleavage/methylation domain-containing protein [Synergistaceae bacterium]
MKIRRGFTLIEALVSMAVIAILAALGYMGVDEYV